MFKCEPRLHEINVHNESALVKKYLDKIRKTKYHPAGYSPVGYSK